MQRIVVAMGIMMAALLPLPALAQTVSVLVGTGPGVAGAAGTVAVSGAILAIDAAKREVTLKGEGTDQVVIEAGPEVKNFAQLAVGDQVDIEFTRALSLELRKGSTAAVSRTDDVERQPAAAGAKPGGAIGRRVVIMAEVTAKDAAKHTVTLKGPKHSLDIEIADPAQFAGIALGDRVEATYVEAIAVAVTPQAVE